MFSYIPSDTPGAVTECYAWERWTQACLWFIPEYGLVIPCDHMTEILPATCTPAPCPFPTSGEECVEASCREDLNPENSCMICLRAVVPGDPNYVPSDCAEDVIEYLEDLL